MILLQFQRFISILFEKSSGILKKNVLSLYHSELLKRNSEYNTAIETVAKSLPLN